MYIVKKKVVAYSHIVFVDEVRLRQTVDHKATGLKRNIPASIAMLAGIASFFWDVLDYSGRMRMLALSGLQNVSCTIDAPPVNHQSLAPPSE